MDKQQPVTRLLAAWRDGDAGALEELTPMVYQALRRLSARHLSAEQSPTIQATELVHEAFLELAGADIDWQDRAHFYAVASRMIRRLLINRANARHRLKRGGGLLRAQLDPDLLSMDDAEEHILALHDALLRLEREDKRKADVLELHFFGGMNYREIAAALAISEATVDRDLRFAKAWVCADLQGDECVPRVQASRC